MNNKTEHGDSTSKRSLFLRMDINNYKSNRRKSCRTEKKILERFEMRN